MYNSKAAAGDVSQNVLMDEYLTNVKDYEETKNIVSGLEGRIHSAQKEYDNYAPAGVNLKRIEREIAVA